MTPIITALIPILVPMLVSQIKKMNIPTWILPIVSLILGASTEVTNQLVLGGIGSITIDSPIAGGMLGLAGVGVREMIDQIKKTIK